MLLQFVHEYKRIQEVVANIYILFGKKAYFPCMMNMHEYAATLYTCSGVCMHTQKVVVYAVMLQRIHKHSVNTTSAHLDAEHNVHISIYTACAYEV